MYGARARKGVQKGHAESERRAYESIGEQRRQQDRRQAKRHTSIGEHRTQEDRRQQNRQYTNQFEETKTRES